MLCAARQSGSANQAARTKQRAGQAAGGRAARQQPLREALESQKCAGSAHGILGEGVCALREREMPRNREREVYPPRQRWQSTGTYFRLLV
jgi:hypothetical protein